MSDGRLEAGSAMRATGRTSHWPVLLAVTIGLVGTACFATIFVRQADVRATEAFEARANERLRALAREIEAELEVIQSLGRFLQADNVMDIEEFREFVRPALEHHPSLQALEWIPRVRAEERGAHEAEMNRVYGDYIVTERGADGALMRAATRGEYYPVAWVEPVESNMPAIGYDVASQPDRLVALQQARDEGRSVASSKVWLVQEREESVGFLVFHPIYTRGSARETVEERRLALSGFALGVLRLQAIVAAAVPPAERVGDYATVFEIDDLMAPLESRTLWGERTRSGTGGAVVERDIDVGARRWRVTCRPARPLLLAQANPGFWLLVAAGVGASLLLGAYLHVILRRQARVEQEVRLRTTDLAEARRRLEETNAELRREASERKAGEIERVRVATRMQEAQKLESLGVLAGGDAHDFNNLLVCILANAGVAKGQIPPRSMAGATLADIEKAALQAADLTKQMLAFSGRGRFVVETIDLSLLVHDMGCLVRASIPKNVSVHEELCPDPVLVDGDGTQLRQIVMNLLTNAAEAFEGERGTVLVETGTLAADRAMLAEIAPVDDLAPGTYAVLVVSDQGVGMDDDTVARMFDPFFTTKFTGRGLGLAAVRGIVHSHDGALHVVSQKGESTTVRVLIPASKKRAWPEGENGHGPNRARDSGTVLVVDDEETVRNAVRLTLESSGFDVIDAADGDEGIAAFTGRRTEVSAVVLDLTMPTLGGEECFKQLRAIRDDVPIVLVSGYDERDIGTRIEGWSRARFLQKPFRAEELLDAMRAVIEE